MFFIPGWWFGTFGLFSIQLGISWSQLRNSYYFGGVAQPPTRYDWEWLSHWSSNMMWLVSIHTPSYHHISGKWIFISPSRKRTLDVETPPVDCFPRHMDFPRFFCMFTHRVHLVGTGCLVNLHRFPSGVSPFLICETMAMNANYNPITRRNPVGLGLWIP